MVTDLPEKSSLHMATIPTSFPGQHLYPAPKPIVSAIPFTSGNGAQLSICHWLLVSSFAPL